MSATKRRQVDKTQTAKQSYISFQQTKMQGSEFTLADRINFQKYLDEHNQNFNYDNGMKDSKSPYKSSKRINQLVKNSPHFSQCGIAKTLDNQALSLLQRSSSFMSKPSSVTTACTYAPNEYSVSKSDYSQVMSQKSKKEQTSDKKQSTNKRLAGSKRPNESDPEQTEYFLKILHSKAAKHVLQSLKLRNKKTGQVIQFSLVNEEKVEALRDPLITDFDTTKLEIEYDYDTDYEQMTTSKKMLLEELRQAIDFFIKEDPLKLVDNIFL